MKRFIASVMVLPMVAVSAAVLDAPTEIEGCVLWLDAADGDSLTLDGGAVAEWRDKSGGDGHVAQGDANHRPAFSAGQLNGRATLRFSGDEWLAGPAVLAQGAQGFGYYIVWRRADTGSAGVVFEQSGADEQQGTRASFLTLGDTFGFCGAFNDAWDIAAFTPGGWKVSGLEYNANAWNTVCLDDETGTRTADADRVNPVVQQVGTAGIRVGNKLANNGECLNGDIAEIIVFDRVLSDMERERVLYYLQEKWQVGSRYIDGMWVSFEHGWYPDGWVAQGDAFTQNPTASTRQFFNKQGDWFVNTFDGPGNTDSATGTLTGTPFVLSSNTLRLLVGGGYQEDPGNGLCQVRLERETAGGGWEVVRKATGANDDAMRETRWNVDNLKGQTVRFAAEDAVPGGWGYISFDALRLVDEPMFTAFHTDFNTGTLPPELVVQRPVAHPAVELTENQTLRFALPEHAGISFDTWMPIDRSPKALLQTFNADRFSMQTYVSAFSSVNETVHCGIVLNCEAVGATRYRYWMFGPFGLGNTLCMERTEDDKQSVSLLRSQVTNIYLRVDGYQNQVTFSCSEDGEAWDVVGTGTVPDDAPLLNAGLFLKNWNGDSTLCEAEFGSLSYTSSQVAPNSPLDIPGCVLWLDAADSGTLVSDELSDAVSLWKDKSGWGNDVQQANAVYQPRLSPASLNALPSVRFDGHAYLEGPQALVKAAPQFSYYIVWRRDDNHNGAESVFEQSGGGNGCRAALMTRDEGVGFCGEFNDAFGMAPFMPEAWKLSALEFNGQPEDNVYLDDEAGVMVATIDAALQQVGIEGTRVGCKLTTTSEFLNGSVAEILVFKRILTAAERYNVLYHLQSKWGVGDNYDAEPNDLATASLTVGGKPVDLHGAVETYRALTLADTAHVTNGTLIVTEAFNPCGTSTVDSLTLADGAIIGVHDRPTVHVQDALTLGEYGTFALPEGTIVPRLTLFTFDQLLGGENLAGWTISGTPARAKTELTQEGDTIVLRVFYPATLILLK